MKQKAQRFVYTQLYYEQVVRHMRTGAQKEAAPYVKKLRTKYTHL
jgi:hypothetical protein